MPSTRQSVTILLFTMLIVALAACAGPTQPPAPTFTLFPSVPPPAQATQTTILPTEGPPPASFAITPENANAIQVQVAGDTGGQAINVLRVAPDGTIGVATAGGALLYDPTTLQQVGTLATGDLDGMVTLWDTSAGAQVGQLNVWQMAADFDPMLAGEFAQPVQSIAFSPDGVRLAVQPVDGMLVFTDVAGGGTPHVFTALEIVAGPVAIAVPAPDFHTFGWWSRASFTVIDVALADILFVVGEPDFLNGVGYSPDSRLIVTAVPGIAGGSEGTFVRLWDAATGAELTVLDTGAPFTKQAEFAPDGTFLVVWSSEGLISVWGVAPPQ